LRIFISKNFNISENNIISVEAAKVVVVYFVGFQIKSHERGANMNRLK
jgi:hypothetical protein